MMSGEFQTISPDLITIEERIRKNLTNIDELAESIKLAGGLIHPIVLTREFVLVAGERRLTACRQLGLTEIPFQFLDELSETDRHIIEDMENVQRVDVPWQDRARSMERLHETKKKTEKNWTNEDTAKLIGTSRQSVERHLTVAKEMKDERVAKADSINSANNIAVRIRERRKADEPIHIGTPCADTPFLHQPFQTWAVSYTGPKFNLIHCDFPYGINADKAQQGTAAKFAGYSDNPQIYWELLDTFLVTLDNFCADSAHLIFWFSMAQADMVTSCYEETLQKLSREFIIDHFPLIWHKSDNVGFLPDPTRGPRRTYETAFFGRRGDRKIIRAKANSFSSPTVEGHTHEKPVEMLTHFMEMLVDENTAILDPTCGSGSSLRTAKALGASRFLGLDTNTEHIADAISRF